MGCDRKGTSKKPAPTSAPGSSQYVIQLWCILPLTRPPYIRRLVFWRVGVAGDDTTQNGIQQKRCVPRNERNKQIKEKRVEGEENVATIPHLAVSFGD